MFKFIQKLVLVVGVLCSNAHLMMAQHPNVIAVFSLGMSGSSYIGSYSINGIGAPGNPYAFDLDIGITSFHVWGPNPAPSDPCSYYFDNTFASTPFGSHTMSINPPCGLATLTYGAYAFRHNNNLTLGSLFAQIGGNAEFGGLNFDQGLQEYLHIDIYDNAGCTGTPMTAFDLGTNVSSFSLADQVSPEIFQSLISMQFYLKVCYLSPTVPYTTSDFVVLPLRIIDQVDLSASVFFPNQVSCHGGGDGGINITKIVLKSGQEATTGDELRFTLKKLIGEVWMPFVPDGYNIFYQSTNYNAPAGSPLTADTYRLVVWGSNLAADSTDNFVIGEPTEVTFSSNITQPVCSSDKGTVVINPSGGNGGYTVTVNNLSLNNDFTFTSLDPATYPVTIKDTKLCEAAPGNVVIIAGTDPYITTNVSQPACIQNNNGSISLNLSGAPHSYQAGYTYYLNNTPTDYPFSSLSPGPYSVKLKDDRGCTSNITNDALNYDISNDPVIAFNTITQPKCLGQFGSIALNVSSGHGPALYTYKCTGQTDVPNQIGSYTFPYLQEGVMNLSVTDAMGCPSITISTTLAYANILTITGTPVVKQTIGSTNYHFLCNGDLDGAIAISASSTPKSISFYQLFDSNDVEISTKYDTIPNKFNSLNAGIYKIKITDGDNCTKTSVSLSLVEPPKVTITPAQLLSTNVKCNGGNDGTISINAVTGGTGMYVYSFDNGNGFDNINHKEGCSATTYQLVARDGQGCLSDVVGKTITQPATLTVSPVALTYSGGNNVSCNGSADGRIQATISGGTTNYNAYLFYATDIPAPDYSNAIDSRTGITGASPSPIFSGLSLGNYKVAVSDANGCSTIQAISLTNQPVSISIADVMPKYKINQDGSVSDYHLSCNSSTDGQIDVTITGGTLPYIVYLKKTTTTVPIQKTINTGSTVTFGDNQLGAGIYQVRVVDANGCQFPADGSYQSTTYVLTEPQPIAFSLPLPSNNGYYIPCNGSVISLTPQVTGGNGSYNENNYAYTWSNGQSTKTAYGLSAGFITLTVSDNRNCPPAYSSVIINQPNPVYFTTPQVTRPKCAYSSDGQIEISALGGVPSYIYKNNVNGDVQYTTPALFNGLEDGSYLLSIEDSNGCTHDTSVVVENYPVLSLSVTDKGNPHCYGGTDGWLQVRGYQGNPANGNYKFRLFNDGVKTDSVTGPTARFNTLSAGSYRIDIMDGFGCTDNITSTISPATQIKYTITSAQNQCFNDNTAQLKVKATEGYGNFQFAYRFGTDSLGFTLMSDSTLHLSNLNWNQYNSASPLEYHIYIRDDNYVASQSSCIVHEMVMLPIIEKMTPHIINSPISCLGANDGSMTVSQVENAQGPISYSWLGPKDGIEYINTNGVTGLSPGIYTVTVKDQVQCESSDSRIFTSPPPMSITVMNTISESGVGMNDGKAFFEVNGTGDTILYWIDGGLAQRAVLENMSFKAEPIATGSHTVSISNLSSLSCNTSTTFNIKHQPPLLAILGKRNATFGNTDGMISVTASGGVPGYTYIWTNETGDTLKQYNTSIADGLGKGTYSVVVMDSEGNLSDASTFTIIESNELSITLISQTSPICRLSANGVVRASAGGGNRPYTYWWTDDQGATVGLDSLADNLLSGNYTAYVRDSRNIEASILVSVEPVDSIKDITLLVAEPKCYNESSGKIQVTTIQGGSGNFSYQWSTGSVNKDLDNLSLGTYTVTVIDNAAPGQVCFFKKSVAIASQPNTIVLKTDSVITPVCYGGSDGKIYVSSIGGTAPYTIGWTGTLVTGNVYYNASAGEYAVNITDANGCKLEDTVTVINPLQLQFDPTITQPKCVGESNGSISLMMLNGRPSYSAKWTPELYTNSLKVDVLAGSYAVEITDANGCKVNGNFDIISPKALKADSFLVSMPGCSNTADGSLRSVVSGGTPPYVYKWSDYQKGQTATKLAGGNYSVTVTDNNLCQTSSQIELFTPAQLKFKVNAQEPSCSGYADGSLSVTPQGGTGAYTCAVNLRPIGLNITGINAGTYSVVVKDVNNCSASQIILLNEPAPMVTTESILSPIKCANQCDGQVKLNVSGSFAPYTALWDDAGTGLERDNMCAGILHVQISDSRGCQVSKFITMETPNPITLDNIVITNPKCAGDINGSIKVVCSGGMQPFAINWNNGQTGNTAQGLGAAEYTVTIADANNCSISRAISVEDPAKETIVAIPVKFALCEGQQNIIDPGTWATYAWYRNNIKVSDTSKFNANQPGSYKLSVVSRNGCKDSTEFNIQVSKDLLSAMFLVPNEVITDDTVEIVDVSWPVPDSISWYIDSDNTQIIEQLADRQQLVFKNAGEYTIRLVAHKALCVSEDEQTITVYDNLGEKIDGKQPIKPPSDIEELYLYPNPSKGTFTVKIKLTDISKVSLKIVKMVDNTLIAVKESENSDLYEVPFDLPGIVSGVYLLNVQTGTSRKTVKFVVIN